MLVVRMMIQCITDLLYKADGHDADTEYVRTVALFDCFCGRGFIAASCKEMGYDIRKWRRLAAGYLRGDVNRRAFGARIGEAIDSREAA
jgi:hypothetical protein